MLKVAYDSMPPASEDFRLKYEGNWRIPSHCRVRVYYPDGKPPVIVATQAYDFDFSGTSITNRAELVHRLAWSRIGEQWPVVFVEHYAEEQDADYRDPDALGENWRFVTFPLNEDGTPKLREDLSSGRVTMVTKLLDDPDEIELSSDLDDRLTLDIAFGKPCSISFLTKRTFNESRGCY